LHRINGTTYEISSEELLVNSTIIKLHSKPIRIVKSDYYENETIICMYKTDNKSYIAIVK